MSEREEWADLIRNEYDPAPSHYRMGDDWDDGAGRIADAILADKTLLLRKHAERLADVVMMLDTPDAYNRKYIAAVCRSILSSVSSGNNKEPYRKPGAYLSDGTRIRPSAILHPFYDQPDDDDPADSSGVRALESK